MKTIRTKLGLTTAILLLLLQVNSCFSQLEHSFIGLPVNAKINSLQVFDNNIYAGTNYGIYISKDNSKTWTAANYGLPENIRVYSLKNCKNHLLAGTQKGMYCLTLGLATWIKVDMNISKWFVYPEVPINSFASTDSNLYAATPAGIYYTNIHNNDSSKIWANGNPEFSKNPTVYTIICNGSVLMAGTDAGVILSKDYGKTWKSYENNINKTTVYILSLKHNRIYAGTNKGVFVTNDNGDNWTEINNSIQSLTVYTIEIIENKIFAGTDKGLYYTTNEGIDWHLIDNALLGLKITSLENNQSELYIGTTGKGVWHYSLSELAEEK